MKKSPFKMSCHDHFSLLCYMLLCCLLCLIATPINAAPSVEPAFYGSGATMPSSIYTYTIANQKKQQQQQQQLNNDISYSSSNHYNNYRSNNNKNKNNLINYTTNTNYRSGNTNRNFYYTNTNTKDTLTSSAAAAASTAFSAASSSSSSMPQPPAQPSPPLTMPLSGCTLDRLVVYKVVLHTYWTRDLFPKHYPDWRPSPQWTKTIGRTHDSAYALYHIGQKATPGVKQFTKTGVAHTIDSEMQQQPQQQRAQPSMQQQQQQPLLQHGERSVFDEFSIPAITTGAGRSEAKIFVDSNHSLVSLMTRIVPSPDWFIGVDSLQLCVGGSWIDTVTVEMDPLDAGIDNGLTFTAASWPTDPQGEIYRITSRYPAIPGSSFYYPESKRLPPIATFQFIKLKEYEISEVFNFAEDDRKYETVKTETHLESEHNHVEMNNELSASIERERQNEVTAVPTSVTKLDRIRFAQLAIMNPMYNGTQYPMNMNAVPKNNKTAIMQNIASSYQQFGSNVTTESTKKSRRLRAKKRDCRVSHWSDWSACSKTCGIGEMHRFRKVIKHGKRGGRPCPALKQSRWCGSEKGCQRASYFNWAQT